MESSSGNRFRAYIPLLLSLFLVIGILLGIFLSGSSRFNRMVPGKDRSDKISGMLQYIRENYVDTVNPEQLMEAAISGMLEDLDPHSQYLPPEDFSEVSEQLRGNFEGIGVQFRMVRDTVIIINTIAGGPSEKAGVRGGDRIIRIEGKTVAGVKMSDKDIIKQLKGTKGTKVKIEIKRRNVEKLIPFTLTRDVIPTYSIDAFYMAEPGTGYIKLSKFAATTVTEMHAAMESLQKQGMKQLILDLRGNGGGYLDAAVKLADEFLPDKAVVVYTEGQNRPRKNYYATTEGSFEKGKLIVLIDEGSASASEIIAGAIQDNDRGTIVGRRSFGKGLVQEQLDFHDGSAVRLTVARYYTPSGRCIQKPYDKGSVDYNHESIDRFTNGEVEHPDSIHFADTMKYKTLKGRVVYGGGGIMPDEYIALKRDSANILYNKLINSGAFNQWTFEYADKNRQKLSQWKDYTSFDRNFSITPEILGDFLAYARREGVNPRPNELQPSKAEIEALLKSLIARHLFDDKGFYPIYNKTDKTFLKALEIARMTP